MKSAAHEKELFVLCSLCRRSPTWRSSSSAFPTQWRFVLRGTDPRRAPVGLWVQRKSEHLEGRKGDRSDFRGKRPRLALCKDKGRALCSVQLGCFEIIAFSLIAFGARGIVIDSNYDSARVVAT